MKKKNLVLLASLALIAGLMSAGTSSALPGVVQCGQVITASTTLANDVGPCPGDGIVIGADNITLNLNGHTIYGVPTPQAKISYSAEVRVNGEELVNEREDNAGYANTASTGVGVRVGDPVTGLATSFSGGYDGVTIKGPGTIRDFDAGVAIERGSGNTVTGLTLKNNFSDGKAFQLIYGDGIALNSADNNVLKNNVITGSGPFSGISMFGTTGSDGNLVEGNKIHGNSRPTDRSPLHHGAVGFSQETDGVRVEPGSNNNVVKGNDVRGSGLDGIAIFALTNGNQVLGNTVKDNGYDTPLQEPPSQRRGDGIRLFNGARRANGTIVPGASTALVQGNTVTGNAAHGIILGNFTMTNKVLNNTATGNFIVDLYDDNQASPCGTNTWSGNVYQTAAPDCTKG